MTNEDEHLYFGHKCEKQTDNKYVWGKYLTPTSHCTFLVVEIVRLQRGKQFPFVVAELRQLRA